MEEMVNQKQNEFNGIYSISDYAISFIYGMKNEQRKRFKEMLKNGFDCGKSVALNYNINYDDFIKEVKRILDVEENDDKL